MRRRTIKRVALLLLAAVLLATAGAALTQSSDSFDLSWNVIAGGGGRSASSSYEVRGTIGQPLAGLPPSASAHYAVKSGFWAGAPLETPTLEPTPTPPPTLEPETWELYLPAIANRA